MAKRWVFYVLFGLLLSSLGTAERLAINLTGDQPSAFSIDSRDSSTDFNPPSPLLKRSARAKSFLKSMPSLHTALPEIASFGRLNHQASISKFAEQNVYQKINVYRL